MKEEALDHFHPQYRELHAELLARPFPGVAGQVVVSHRAILFSEDESTAHRAAVAALADHERVVASPEENGCRILPRSCGTANRASHGVYHLHGFCSANGTAFFRVGDGSLAARVA
jgi:Protein of unknown function (DUF3422)